MQDRRDGWVCDGRLGSPEGHAPSFRLVCCGSSFVYDRRLVPLMRDLSITEKIPREKTGLRTNLYAHIRFDELGRIAEIRISEQGKDGSTLDRILNAIGDTLTNICSDVNAEKK